MICLLLFTIFFGSIVIIAELLGIEHRPNSVYDWAPHAWARALLWVSGVKVRTHHDEHTANGQPRIFVSNHVSWYDVLALASFLPAYRFVAKAELMRVPLFGRATRAVGVIPIERENRKAAFAAYETAAKKIREGSPVIVYPEGTRGSEYALRPFKKGPFVLAIAAGVPVVPVVIHGTIRILPRGSLWLTPGTIDIHFLEPVPTAGLGYDDRDALSRAVYDRMASALRTEYGVESPPFSSRPVPRETPVGQPPRFA
jgi:1-acyl-sn-glycerol-3-phosphate acyltransferase